MSGATESGKSEKKLKLTAALYAKLKGVVEHARATGHLPPAMQPQPFHVIPVRLLIEEWGDDITLSPVEQLVYEAMVRDGHTPGGSVVLVKRCTETR